MDPTASDSEIMPEGRKGRAMISKSEMFKWFFTNRDLYDTVKRAGNGEDASMVKLANAFYYGEGPKLDLKEAVSWYQKASDLGNAEAMCLLGYCLRVGAGTEKNEASALAYLSITATSPRCTKLPLITATTALSSPLFIFSTKRA